MTDPLLKKYAPLFANVTLGIVWFYTFYQSVLAPPFFGYYTVDENYISDSGVFLWYGNTPRCLDWPATPSVLMFFLMFGIVIVYQIIAGLGNVVGIIDLFERVDWAAFQYLTNREDLILAGRTVQLLIVGLFLWLTLRYIFQKQHILLTDLSRSVLALVLLSSYIVWFNAPFLRPEALSGSIFIYILTRLLFTESLSPRQCYMLAALFGVVLAERLLFVFVAPIVLAGIYFMAPAKKMSITFRCLVLTVAVFILLCPFLLTDPMVVLKSFFGGILAKMQDKPMETFFNQNFISSYFFNPVSYLLLLLSLLGVWSIARQKSVFYYILIVNWLFFLFLVLRSAKIYDTHVLPAGIINLVMVGLGISYLAQKTNGGRIPVASLLLVIIMGSNVVEIVKFQNRTHTISNIQAAYGWVTTLPENSRLLVHPEMEIYLPKTNECLAREFDQNRDSVKMVRKLNYLLGNKGGGEIASNKLPFVARSFAFEDERLYEIQYQLQLKYNDLNPVKKFDYYVYLETTELASHSVETKAAIKDFESGKYDFMITELQLEGKVPIKSFSNNLHEPIYAYKSK